MHNSVDVEMGMNKDHTDTIHLEGSGRYLELEEFKDEIQQLHGQGMVRKAFYIDDDVCIECWDGRILKQVLVGT